METVVAARIKQNPTYSRKRSKKKNEMDLLMEEGEGKEGS